MFVPCKDGEFVSYPYMKASFQLCQPFHIRAGTAKTMDTANVEAIAVVCASKVERTVGEHFGSTLGKLMSTVVPSEDALVTHEELRRCFFGDYMNVEADPSERQYQEVSDVEQLLSTMEQYLVDYNATSKRPMNLAMFLFAVEHVSRVCRILKQPGGHALLVGVGGSGRQSLTRLAAFICGMELFQVRTEKLWHMHYAQIT